MATKNLARTVIEGGRARGNKWDRRRSNVEERRRAHQTETSLLGDDPFADAYFQPRNPVYKGFDDKLGPARRYLRSQVGRPWDLVQSELFARFDLRTTAGRHILFDHLLQEVLPEPPSRFARWNDFRISRHGILQYRRHERFQRWRRAPLPEPERVLWAWIADRRVRVCDQRLYWLIATPYGSYRQARELKVDEAARYRALPAWFREQVEDTSVKVEGRG